MLDNIKIQINKNQLNFEFLIINVTVKKQL